MIPLASGLIAENRTDYTGLSIERALLWGLNRYAPTRPIQPVRILPITLQDVLDGKDGPDEEWTPGGKTRLYCYFPAEPSVWLFHVAVDGGVERRMYALNPDAFFLLKSEGDLGGMLARVTRERFMPASFSVALACAYITSVEWADRPGWRGWIDPQELGDASGVPRVQIVQERSPRGCKVAAPTEGSPGDKSWAWVKNKDISESLLGPSVGPGGYRIASPKKRR